MPVRPSAVRPALRRATSLVTAAAFGAVATAVLAGHAPAAAVPGQPSVQTVSYEQSSCAAAVADAKLVIAGWVRAYESQVRATWAPNARSRQAWADRAAFEAMGRQQAAVFRWQQSSAACR
ncbi:hypothetical protein [Nakamurella endophytica]|uniref:Ig-like domain-containing protein n=1 Tax=Nakamurella endophytica TaxID=1748367 RepID=A0A917SNX2_9ACTN|nr:hypothetical protein [Nakamurella endophytica]GGL88048.1 hypothetical protein GCM10011594_04620 [Nakamurella endophytica]